MAFAKLGRNAPPCTTAGAALPGARGFHTRADLQREAAAQFGNPANHDALLHLLEAHGSAYRDVMEIGEVAADRSPDAILRGRWRYAVRAEMAMRLSDIVFRRTDAAVRDELSEPMLLWAADMMAGEFGWSETVKQHQLGECRCRLPRPRVSPRSGVALLGSPLREFLLLEMRERVPIPAPRCPRWVLALIPEGRAHRCLDHGGQRGAAQHRARDTGEGYRGMLERLAQESGIETPTAEDLARLDRKRKGKKLSNQDWVSRSDPEAKIAKMKDGTTARAAALG